MRTPLPWIAVSDFEIIVIDIDLELSKCNTVFSPLNIVGKTILLSPVLEKDLSYCKTLITYPPKLSLGYPNNCCFLDIYPLIVWCTKRSSSQEK